MSSDLRQRCTISHVVLRRHIATCGSLTQRSGTEPPARVTAGNKVGQPGVIMSRARGTEHATRGDQELPGVPPRQRGHRGVIEAFRIWPEQWDDYRIEILRIADSRDQVVVTTRTAGRGKQSGIDVEMEFSFVFTVRNAKITEMRIFMREDQALEAAGLPR